MLCEEVVDCRTFALREFSMFVDENDGSDEGEEEERDGDNYSCYYSRINFYTDKHADVHSNRYRYTYRRRYTQTGQQMVYCTSIVKKKNLAASLKRLRAYAFLFLLCENLGQAVHSLESLP